MSDNQVADIQNQSPTDEPQQQRPVKSTDQNALFLRAARAGNLDHVLEFLRNGIDINTCNSNGLNALHLASKEGHGTIVRELLRRGAQVDAATKKGNTALHIASLAGQDIVVTILVENGANVNTQSLNGFTPLYMASQENHEVVVRYLLANGANPALSTEDGFTPLAVALQQGHDRIVALLLENDNTSKVKLPALHIAAKKDDVRAATLLLQNEQNPNQTSKSGFTPLHIAAHYGNEAIAQLLLEKGANVNFQARHNISPLHVASKWGRPNLCNLLLAHDAIIDCRTRDLLTPLHCAARSGHDQVVELLIAKGAPIAAKTKNGLAPLHMASQGNHVGCARILLYNKAQVDEVTVDYLTALHVAAHCGHVEVAKLLLDRNADPNARALNGFTPLHIACKKNRIKVVELLLKYHAAIEATTESGLTPLHVASFMGCINIVLLLTRQGANVNCETVRGETPLHLAARANQTDIVRVLVRNKAIVDAQARELQTPLHIASRLGNTDIAMILLSARADPNAATKDLYTPLHIAAKEGQEELAQLLLDHKANKTLLTRKGFAPIHLAAKYANYQVVKLLLDHGTPVDLEGKNMVTPLHVAAHYNNQNVAQLLLERKAKAHAAAKNGYTALHIAAKKNQMEIASSLLAFRADPNAESRAGFTPLHLASEEGHQEMAALLIEAGSKVDACAKNGLAPMHLCAQEDHVGVAGELFKNGANLNAQTNALYTPLHVACHFGQLNMVRFLVENGALINAETKAGYTPLHQAAQQGHNHVVRYLLEHGASPNSRTHAGQTPLSIAQRLGYVSIVETLKTVTETTVITETTTITEERYKPQNPEAMNETMFSDSEDEADDHQAAVADHARDFNESITQGLRDSAVVHLMTGEQMKDGISPFDSNEADLEALIKKAQNEPVLAAIPDSTYLIENGHDDNDNTIIPRDFLHPSFLISFLVDARGGAMRGCRHSGIRVIIPPRKASAPIRITCRYLKKEKLSHPPPLSEGEALASRILEMGPSGAKFLGPVILEVPHFASLRGREREIVILRSDDGQHWKEHQLEATEDAVQEVLNESFDACKENSDLQQLDELQTSRITRILTNDFPMYFAVVTRVRQEVHCVGPEGGVILSSVVPRVQAIFPDGSLTKTIKVSLQAQPVPTEIVKKLHGNRIAVSPIVTVEPRRRKFHKPITLCIPLPQHGQKSMLTQFAQQPGGEKQQEPPTLRLLCSITGGSAPAQWEDITGTTQLTFTGDEVSFTTTVSARFWLMDCQTPRESAKMAQEIYNEAIAVPYMAKFVVFARRPFPIEGQLRMFCITDDKEDKTLEKQERFVEIARSREVEALSNRYQFLEFAGNIVPVTKRGEQLSLFFLPFQENRLAFNVKVRSQSDELAATSGKIAVMKEPRVRSENLPPQHPICTLTITLPDYTGPLPTLQEIVEEKKVQQQVPIASKYSQALALEPQKAPFPLEFVARRTGQDWPRLARALGLPDSDVRQIKRELNGGSGLEPAAILKIWLWINNEEANLFNLEQALRRIGRDDIVRTIKGLEGHMGDMDLRGSMEAIGTPYRSLSHQQLKPAFGAYETAESVPIQTTVTRTERHIYQPEEYKQPVVDERTITQVFDEHGEDQGEPVVIERKGLPLNEEEVQRWEDEPSSEEREQLFKNSRHAMIVDGEEHPIDDGILRTTTLVTQHVVTETVPHHGEDVSMEPTEQKPSFTDELDEEEEQQKFQQPILAQRQSSPESSGSVIIKEEPADEEPQTNVVEFANEPQAIKKELPEEEEESTPIFDEKRARSGSSGFNAEETETTTEEAETATHTDEGGSKSFDAVPSDVKPFTQDEAVQKHETMDEVSAVPDGSQLVSKRTITTVSTSQSGISGLESYNQLPERPEDDETSIVSEDGSSRSSVRERIAMFESMKLDESGAKYGWQGIIQPFKASSRREEVVTSTEETFMSETSETKFQEKPEGISGIFERPFVEEIEKEGQENLPQKAETRENGYEVHETAAVESSESQRWKEEHEHEEEDERLHLSRRSFAEEEVPVEAIEEELASSKQLPLVESGRSDETFARDRIEDYTPEITVSETLVTVQQHSEGIDEVGKQYPIEIANIDPNLEYKAEIGVGAMEKIAEYQATSSHGDIVETNIDKPFESTTSIAKKNLMEENPPVELREDEGNFHEKEHTVDAYKPDQTKRHSADIDEAEEELYEFDRKTNEPVQQVYDYPEELLMQEHSSVDEDKSAYGSEFIQHDIREDEQRIEEPLIGIHEKEDDMPARIERDGTNSSLETEATTIVTVMHKSDQEDLESEGTVAENESDGAQSAIETRLEPVEASSEPILLVESEPMSYAREELAVSKEFPSDTYEPAEEKQEEMEDEFTLPPAAVGGEIKTRSLYKKLANGEHFFQRQLSVDERHGASTERSDEMEEAQRRTRSQSLGVHRFPIIEIIPPDDGEKEQWEIAEQDFVPEIFTTTSHYEQRQHEEGENQRRDVSASPEDVTKQNVSIVESEIISLPGESYAKIHTPPEAKSQIDEKEEISLFTGAESQKHPSEAAEDEHLKDRVEIIIDEVQTVSSAIKSDQSVERELSAKVLVDEALATAIDSVDNKESVELKFEREKGEHKKEEFCETDQKVDEYPETMLEQRKSYVDDNNEVAYGSELFHHDIHEYEQKIAEPSGSSLKEVKKDFGGFVQRQKLSIEELQVEKGSPVSSNISPELEMELEREADVIIKDAIEDSINILSSPDSMQQKKKEVEEYSGAVEFEEEPRIDWEEDEEEEEEELIELSKGGETPIDKKEQGEDFKTEEESMMSGVPSRVKTIDSLMPASASPFQRPKSPVPPSYVETPPILKHTRIDWPDKRGTFQQGASVATSSPDVDEKLSEDALKMESENEPPVDRSEQGEERGTPSSRGELSQSTSPQFEEVSPQPQLPSSPSQHDVLGDSDIEYPLDVPEEDIIATSGEPAKKVDHIEEESNEKQQNELYEKFLEECDSSLGSSPAKRPTNHEHGSSGENISGGEGSLLEFEQLEMEIRSGAKSETEGKPEFSEEEKAVTGISGSMGSLTEFESIERDIQEQIKKEDEIMILSDICEESEEAEELQGTNHQILIGSEEEKAAKVEDEEEPMDQREDPIESTIEAGVGGRDTIENNKNLLEAEIAREGAALMQVSADSLEMGGSHLEMMETSQDSLEIEVKGLPQQNFDETITGKAMSAESLMSQEENGLIKKDEINRSHSIEVKTDIEQTSKSDGDKYETTKTIFETIYKNKSGEDEKIVREVITKCSDPIHNKVKFAGTENEDKFLEISRENTETEFVDEDGNVTNISLKKAS